MADKLIYIPNNYSQNDPFYSVKLVVEHSTKWTNQSKFTKVPKVAKPNGMADRSKVVRSEAKVLINYLTV